MQRRLYRITSEYWDTADDKLCLCIAYTIIAGLLILYSAAVIIFLATRHLLSCFDFFTMVCMMAGWNIVFHSIGIATAWLRERANIVAVVFVQISYVIQGVVCLLASLFALINYLMSDPKNREVYLVILLAIAIPSTMLIAAWIIYVNGFKASRLPSVRLDASGNSRILSVLPC